MFAPRESVKLTELCRTSGLVPAVVGDGEFESSDLQGRTNSHDPRRLV